MSKWMIYGANGYTAKLILDYALSLEQKPILAGRNEAKVSEMALAHNLPYRVFDVSNKVAAVENLKDIDIVLHCAGPFSQTSQPMLEACLAAKTHYLDITGEIGVFERVFSREKDIQAAGILAIPGVGFDVVPSDCISAQLKERMPDATELSLAFSASGGISPGTLKTAIEGLPHGSMVRRNGKLTPIKSGSLVRKIDFGKKELLAVAIPWGDLATAYRSTAIPNITTYLAINKTMLLGMKASSFFQPLLKAKAIIKLLQRIAAKYVSGPDHELRERSNTYMWGEVKNGLKSEVMTLKLMEGYNFTAIAAVQSVLRIQQNRLKAKAGALTPSQAFGSKFVNELVQQSETGI